MTAGAVVGLLVGLGVLGLLRGLTAAPPSLDSLVATLDRPVPAGRSVEVAAARSERLGALVISKVEQTAVATHPRWAAIVSSLAVTGGTADQLGASVVLAAAVGLLGPPFLWVLTWPWGAVVPLGGAVAAALLATPLCAAVPVVRLGSRARARRRHFRSVVGSFVDLVVLSLAGGVGVEGALLAATQISPDWAVNHMGRALVRARESGGSPWEALGRLGQELGVPELEGLASSLQLAGTEGARIRQSLSARASSLRRHEQAEAESSANATTERLFLPSALLLVGFLLFVGYPAFSRILGGW